MNKISEYEFKIQNQNPKNNFDSDVIIHCECEGDL